VLPIGLSDKLRTSRVKVYCPRCEECYIPKQRNVNLDGYFFGTALPHIFMKTYPYGIILPPKVYFYQPQIFGFKIAGKRGSKYYKATKGSVIYTEEAEGNIKELIGKFKQQYSI
jgi:casein kinase II subunit beta